jgi:hypothetical protein
MEPQPVDHHEMLAISADQVAVPADRCGGDQRIERPQTM